MTPRARAAAVERQFKLAELRAAQAQKEVVR